MLGEAPALEKMMNSLHKCQYREFFVALVEVVDQLHLDPFLAPHTRYFLRQARIVAYTQYLESYHTVELKSMAATFGVTVPFLDRYDEKRTTVFLTSFVVWFRSPFDMGLHPTASCRSWCRADALVARCMPQLTPHTHTQTHTHKAYTHTHTHTHTHTQPSVFCVLMLNTLGSLGIVCDRAAHDSSAIPG